MSFLDRISKAVSEGVDKAAKAVSEGVDKAKREADRMSRISHIRGEIRDLEKEVAGKETQIQAAKVQLGEKAMAMLKAGTLADPELQGFSDSVAGFEQEIAVHRAAIAEKEAAIEAIRAEGQEAGEPVAEPEETPAEEEAVTGAPCPQCGTIVPEGGSFCPACGARIES